MREEKWSQKPEKGSKLQKPHNPHELHKQLKWPAQARRRPIRPRDWLAWLRRQPVWPRRQPTWPRRRPVRRPRPLPPAVAGLAALTALALLLPALLVARSGPPAPQAAPAPVPGLQSPAGEFPSAADGAADSAPAVSVYLTGTGAIETLPLEQYVLGVLAAEMPADFGIEALKAQAVAARTYIVKRLADGDRSGVPDSDANVTDTVRHQAYLSKAKLSAWRDTPGKARSLDKLEQAVEATKGVVMTYKGKPISALFFSAGGDRTENSEDYWSAKIPYLRSVPSPWDAEIDPDYMENTAFSLADFFAKLGLDAGSLSEEVLSGETLSGGTSSEGTLNGGALNEGALNAGTSSEAAAQEDSPAFAASSQSGSPFPLVQILSRTAGNSVKALAVGGQTFSGREIREKLGLRSSRFQIEVQDGQAVITTYGNGHGVGMSQWGANGMAKNGSTAKEILEHYYTGVSFAQAADILKP